MANVPGYDTAKRPILWQKRPILWQKETGPIASNGKRTWLRRCKETYPMAKETYPIAKETYPIAKETGPIVKDLCWGQGAHLGG